MVYGMVYGKVYNTTTSKQGALKTLNRFVSYGVLKEIDSASKVKLFDVSRSNILYALKNFGYKAR